MIAQNATKLRREFNLTYNYPIFILVFIYCSFYSTLHAAPIYQDVPQGCDDAAVQDIINFSYPILFEELRNIRLTIIQDFLYVIYNDHYCTKQFITDFICYEIYRYSSDIYYQNNGSNTINYDSINITCDLPCLYNVENLDFISCLGGPTEVSVSSLFPLGFSRDPNMYKINGTFTFLSNSTYSHGLLILQPDFLYNDFDYDEPFVLEQGCVPIEDKYINFNYCSSPYCLTIDGIYPSSYLEIVSISSICLGCINTIPVQFTSCELTQKRDYTCEGNCPKSFSISLNSDLKTILVVNNGITVFNGNTTFGSFNFTINDNTLNFNDNQDSSNTIGSAPFWILFAFVMLLYLICLTMLARWLVTSCFGSRI